MDPSMMDNNDYPAQSTSASFSAEETSLATLKPSAKAAIPSALWWLSMALVITGFGVYLITQRPDIAQWFEQTLGAGIPGHILMWGLVLVWVVFITPPLFQLLVLKTTTYHVTNQRLEYTRGILHRRRDQLELVRIRDLSASRTLVQRMLGIGTVIMETVDRSHPIFRIEAQPDVYALSDWLHQLNADERTRLNYREFEGTQGV
ncbi:PH domain-containing protein [Chromohalobacter japonicus]|uniref:PH domain-containing protein n=1 Tax=Chromohalobacter japonicus TaxID=223900 RepID=UPI001FF20B4D|nr:PH domain-containing protein [Chromohalobacter japonicus]MCK0753584.1 PH domain-containing protein [Chromohalobacter japonicus]